jgi:hypothetical protein
MRRTAFAALLCLLAACTWDDHEPCSVIDGKGPVPSAPVPGELPAPGPGPDGLENEASYRMSNGVICRCDGSEIGCLATPEEAERAATCRPSPYGPEYGETCQAVPEGVLPPDGGEEIGPAATYRCEYDRIERKTKKRETKYRWQTAQTQDRANVEHIKWCDEQTRSSPDYVFSCGFCSEP